MSSCSFFEKTGYHSSFIISTLKSLTDQEYDEKSEFIYTAFWDATLQPEVLKLLSEITEGNLPIVLISNLYKIQSKPRLFEITCGVLVNISSSGHFFTKTTEPELTSFIELLENLLKIEIGVPEAYTQLVKFIHVILGRFPSGINQFVFIDQLLFLVQNSQDTDLIKEVVDLLYTVTVYDKNNKITDLPEEAFLLAVNEFKSEDLLEFDTFFILFPGSERILGFYKKAFEVSGQFSEISEVLKTKLTF